jgi:hypothetical protein
VVLAGVLTLALARRSAAESEPEHAVVVTPWPSGTTVAWSVSY